MKILRCLCFYVLVLLCPQTTQAEEVVDNDTFAIYLNKSIESRNKDQIEESTRYLLEGKKYCKTKFQYATIFNSLGRNYSELSDYHTALNYYDSALVVTDTVARPVFLGYLYNNYALVYMQLMDFEKAIDFYQKSALLLDKESIGILYYNISKCYGYLGKKDSTRYYLDKSYSNNVKALGKKSYYTLLTELDRAEINGKTSNSLKERVLKSSDNLLKGRYFTIAGDFEQAEKYLPANSKFLLKLYIKFKKWDKAIAVIDSLQASYLSVDSKLFLQANERLIYKNAIDEFIQTDTVKAFKTALKSHANVLKENIPYHLNHFPDSYNYLDFDSVIYLFLIDNSNIRFYNIKVDSVFQNKLQEFISSFNYRSIADDFMGNYRQYARSSYYLFNALLPELSEDMLIIPEGRLLFVPFEALLTEFPDTTVYPNYKELKYLLYKTDIHYDYVLRDYKKPEGRKSITALSPEPNLEYFIKLTYSIKEVKNLWKYKSKRLTGKKAKLAAIYNGDILHISTHYNPLDYAIHFSDKTLNLDSLGELKKDLVVLSTCYSGFGKSYSGEGMFSAGRAFYLAGAESVIESLWLNNDNNSFNIFSEFYKQLYKGKSKSEALSIAKAENLKMCPYHASHPYFWSTIRVFGNNCPLQIYRNPNVYYSGILLLIVIVIFLYYFLRFHIK
jgi:CHAT domain-containing protein